MSVSGVNNYRDVLFHWQGQQLKNTDSYSSGSSSSSSSLSSLFGGTASMTSQIASMVELTKYAMDKMGLSSDNRVTFSQITKYREQLSSEFSASVKKGFADSGISDIASLSFSLDKDGKISATGGNAADGKKAQEWLDANPSFGKEIKVALEEAGIDANTAIDFRISTSGKMTFIDNTTKSLQAALDEKLKLTEDLRKGLADQGIAFDESLEFVFDAADVLTVKNGGENEEAINKWLAENPEFASEIKGILEKMNIEPSSVTLRLGKEGNLQANVNNAANNDIQAVLDKQSETGSKIMTGLNSLAIDPNVAFSIQVNEDGTVSILSDHPDKEKVQRFFDENPELLKKYQQIETLAGIDDARKAMQVSKSAMRKRIQIESMSAWWASSGNANSYFGTFSDGYLSLMAGLNMKV